MWNILQEFLLLDSLSGVHGFYSLITNVHTVNQETPCRIMDLISTAMIAGRSSKLLTHRMVRMAVQWVSLGGGMMELNTMILNKYVGVVLLASAMGLSYYAGLKQHGIIERDKLVFVPMPNSRPLVLRGDNVKIELDAAGSSAGVVLIGNGNSVFQSKFDNVPYGVILMGCSPGVSEDCFLGGDAAIYAVDACMAKANSEDGR